MLRLFRLTATLAVAVLMSMVPVVVGSQRFMREIDTQSNCYNRICGMEADRSCATHSLLCHSRTCDWYDHCDLYGLALEPAGLVIHGNVKTPAPALFDVLKVQLRPEAERHECAVEFPGTALVFIDYFYYENFYHMHVDLLLRLFAAARDLGLTRNAYESSFMVLPGVRQFPQKGIQWDTHMFNDNKEIWVQALTALAGGPTRLVPLTSATFRKLQADDMLPTCFAHTVLGLPFFDIESGSDYSYDLSDPNWKQFHLNQHGIVMGFPDDAPPMPMLVEYAEFMKIRLRIPLDLPRTIKVGIISRKGRRRIVNEVELVETVKNMGYDVELIAFEGKTFKEQVAAVAKLTVLVGLNGAGLIHGLYLPPGGVAVQLVPYKAPLNYHEFGMLLRSRGPYLEWHNQHEQNAFPDHTDPQPEHNQDTTIRTEEFEQLIGRAVTMGINYDIMTQ